MHVTFFTVKKPINVFFSTKCFKSFTLNTNTSGKPAFWYNSLFSPLMKSNQSITYYRVVLLDLTHGDQETSEEKQSEA